MRRIAIVGRPNVGKSTLFNRLAGRKLAIVHDRPGVTRDRRDTEVRLAGEQVLIVDTAGFEDATDESLEARMRAQTEAAIQQADVVLFVIDGRAGVTPLDEIFANGLRRASKPLILLVNKAEGRASEAGLLEAYSLGLGDPIGVSAEHGLGIGDVELALEDAFDALSDGRGDTADDAAYPEFDLDEMVDTDGDADEGFDARPLHIAIVGRPNAGKSTLINRLLGEDRLLTGPEVGITRDAIAIEWTWKDRAVRLFDTAGMRRKARVQESLEKMSVGESLRAIRFAHVVILLLDADSALEKQDLTLADLVAREGRALIIAINKMDTVDDREGLRAKVREQVGRLLPQVRGVPVLYVSALTGRGLDKLMDAAIRLSAVWNRRIPTSPLNRWLDDVLAAHPPPAPSGRRLKIRYVTQVAARPPSFVAFCSRADAMPESYRRYLLNGLRETFDLDGVPLRLTFRSGENPYADRS